VRILRLSFKNIASFRSEKLFTIDFTISPLSQQSLFLITGSTGAGKSTLLDAITVALYNKYTREKSTNNFLSSLATNAIIEVEYEKDGTEYRNVWKINRSRDKLDGALQQSEMQLSLVKTNEILSSKKSDVILKTTEILGLDFEQFTKTIILPQGDFANFLHAKDDVKIELFEKITDTKKYREFSQFIYQRNKEEEVKLNQIFDAIGNVEPMNQEEEQKLFDEINQLTSQIDSHKNQISIINSKQLQIQTISELSSKVQIIETQLQELNSHKEHFETVEKEISRAENANEILTILQNITQQSLKLAEKKSDLQKTEIKKIELESEVDHSTEELEKIKTSYSVLQTHVKQLYDTLPKYREIVSTINSLTETIERQESDYAKSQIEFKANEETVRELKEEITNNLAKKSEIEVQLQLLFHLDSAPVHIEQITSYQKDIDRLQREQKSLQQSIAELTTEINEKVQESQQKEQTIHTNELKKLPHTIYTDSLEFRYEQLKEFCSFYEGILLKKLELKTLENSVQNLEETIEKSYNDYAKTIAQFASINEEFSKVTNQISQSSLELKLQEYRNQLVEGQPCPLCGSLEHSFDESHSITDDTLVKKIQSLQEQYSALETTKKDLQKSLHNEEQLQQQYTDSIKEIRKKQSTIIEEIQINTIELQKLPFLLDDETFRTVQAEILARDNNKFLQFQIDTDTEQIKKNNLEVAKFQELIISYQLQIEQKSQELDQLSTSIRSIRQLYQISQELSSASFIREVELLYANYKTLRDTASSLQQSIAVSISRNNLLEEENSKISQKITELHTQIYQNKSAVTLVLEEKTILFGQNDIEQQHQVAYKELQTSFLQVQSYEKQHQSKTDNLTTLKNEISKIQEAITNYIEPTINELVVKKSLLVNTYSFTSDEEIYSSAMDETTIQTSKKEVNSYKQNLSNLEFTVKKKKEELEQALQSNPYETIEELTKLFQELDALLAETTQELGAKNLLFQQNEEKQQQYELHKTQYELQKSITNRWNKLNSFIGSNDGKKYQRIVQRITLARLLEYTNIHLKEFSNRYSVSLLSSDNDNSNQSLDLQIQDHDNYGKLRNVSTLSGGETFLVSLSMALGIATMISSTTEVESLFLDEGFGTLDSYTLEIVMQTLENLQQKGRKIGIISHVEQLKERISTQIVVQPLGNGTSTVFVREN
jgi:exonuclease SbcC